MEKFILILLIVIAGCKSSNNRKSDVSGYSPLYTSSESNMQAVKYYGSPKLKGIEICYYNTSNQPSSPSDFIVQVVYDNEIIIPPTVVPSTVENIHVARINFEDEKFILQGSYENSKSAPNKTLTIQNFEIKNSKSIDQLNISSKDSALSEKIVGRFFRWTTKNQDEDLIVLRSWQYYKQDETTPFLVDVFARNEISSNKYLYKSYFGLKKQGIGNNLFYQFPEVSDTPEVKLTLGPPDYHNLKGTLISFQPTDSDSSKFDHICYPYNHPRDKSRRQ